jgi:hypothetical protein
MGMRLEGEGRREGGDGTGAEGKRAGENEVEKSAVATVSEK